MTAALLQSRRVPWLLVMCGIMHGLFSSPAEAQPESIRAILVHGNHTTADGEIRAIAGLTIGDPADDAHLDAAAEKLQSSGRFAAVEVRRRYRSITDASDVVVVILVSERADAGEAGTAPRLLSQIRRVAMWMPVLGREDGYGITYGARVSFVDALGAGGRLSVPFTWGGERRLAAELHRSFDSGPFTSIGGGASMSRRVNPHFDVPVRKRTLEFEAERAFAPWLRAGASAELGDVHVDTLAAAPEATRSSTRYGSVAASLTFDTRRNPPFPRNAVHAHLRWERSAFDDTRVPHRRVVNRAHVDVRSYLGVGGAAVLGLRGQVSRAGAALPFYDRSLLGGTSSVRGYRAGHRAGDSMAAFSAEARLPLTSPFGVGRAGLKAFVDAGTAWNAGARLRKQRFDRGAGGGVYFGAAVLAGSLDVAWPERGKPRVHVDVGVTF